MIFKYLLNIIEVIFFIYLGLSAIYVFVFSFAGLFPYRLIRIPPSRWPRIAVLIPGYKEDRVILEVAQKALEQEYPREQFDVVVIADSFESSTIESLRMMPVRLVEVSFELSTKSKSLNAAMQEIGDDYDLALILDADNIMEPGFLNKLAMVSDTHFKAVQGHRVAKNMNTSMAVLDAISEEINNHIFRKGHRVLGLSSALIGSGMAFDYPFFKELMSKIEAVGGFDKELELSMLKAGYGIEYLDDARVLDEKVQKKEVFAKQRKRWLSAQLIYFSRYAGDGFKDLLKKGNLDFFDKVIQMILPPRILLVGMLFIISMLTLTISLIDYLWFWETFMFSVSNWISLTLLTMVALMLAIPKSLYTLKTLRALGALPGSFMIMLISLFRLKGANKKFIHTQHGIGEESDVERLSNSKHQNK